MKRILIALAAAIISTAAFSPAQAQPHSPPGSHFVVVKKAPPAPRREAVPPARRGYEWAPGYWNWTGKKYTWVKGRYEKARPGYSYSRPEWRREGNGWALNRGGWQAARRGDRDGDGVPNRFDSHPNNPVRH